MALEVRSLTIPDVKVIAPSRFADARGFFSETYSERVFAQAGIDQKFIQDNHSLSVIPGTVRGLHFQTPPLAQDKLVRCVRGAILDVAVDIRRGSPTYGKHVAAEISADNWHQIFVPAGFAHGFCTLVPETEVIYKVSAFYSPEHEKGIAWNDPALAIAWPAVAGALVSPKDAVLPLLSGFASPFTYQPSGA
jgi:dTDP-4-dehydrorhamnose 3,5-epimerase